VHVAACLGAAKLDSQRGGFKKTFRDVRYRGTAMGQADPAAAARTSRRSLLTTVPS